MIRVKQSIAGLVLVSLVIAGVAVHAQDVAPTLLGETKVVTPSPSPSPSPPPTTHDDTYKSLDDCRKLGRDRIDSGRCGLVDSTPFLTVTKIETAPPAPRPYSRFCYYKLSIISLQEPEPEAQINHSKRGSATRFFIGADYSFNSLLKVKAGLYEESVVLYSRKYRSSRDEGENHDRTILKQGLDYPVFLLARDNNGKAGVSVSADMKNYQTFNVAGSALEAISVALKAVAPSADIITTLTSDSAKSVAQKIDAGAGAFSGSTGKNEETFDIDVVGGEHLRVEVFGPRFEVNPGGNEHVLGVWDVGFYPQFASYFFQDVPCAQVNENALDRDGQNDPDHVAWGRRGTSRSLLATKLIGNIGEIGTVASYLKQLPWWSESLAQLTNKAANSDEVEGFCRAITGAISDLGFNTVDAYLVADAVARSELVKKSVGANMRASDSCDYHKRNHAA